MLALAAAGCSAKKGPLRPEPTDEQWEHVMIEPAATAKDPKKIPGPQPKLVLPGDGAEITAKAMAYEQDVLVFTWTESAADSVYTVEVAVDSNFTKVILRKTIPRNTLAYRLSYSGRLYWRVRTDAGVQSNVHSFSVLGG